MLRSFADVLALWTPLQLSRVLEVPYTTAAAMHRRGSIGPAHWARLIEAASARGEIITADMLVKFADARRHERSAAGIIESRVRQKLRCVPTTQNTQNA